MKRLLSALLCVMLIACMMPGMAFADSVDQTNTPCSQCDHVASVTCGESTVHYDTFAEAMTAANSMTGDVKVEIYGEVEFTNGMELKGNYSSITFVGGNESAKITINQSAGGDYLEAHGKTVSFNNLILAKANPKWAGNSGHMGNYFSIQGGTVTYTNCTFPNGACTSGGTAVYNTCTFNNTSEYGLWVYDDALVTVNGGTIDSVKGIKVYSEDEKSVTSTLTVQNATFTANVTGKPAVAIGYAAEIKLIGNTYANETGILELDSGSDAYCEGITFVAQDSEGNDISSTVTVVDRADDKPCGVLVDDKIYTSLEAAVAAAEDNATVTLLADVELDAALVIPAGKTITLDLNGKTISRTSTEATATYVIDNKGTLVVNDSVGTGMIELVDAVASSSHSYATDAIINSGNLTINGGTVKNNLSGASYAIDNNVGGTTTVNGGKIINTKGVAIRVYSWDANTASTLVVKNGEIEGTYAVQAHNLSGTVAGDINITIEGGTLTSTGTTYPFAIYSYCNDGSKVDITITDGTFKGDVALGGGNKANTENVSISGGTFTEVFSYDSNMGKFITGGVFSVEPTEYVVDGIKIYLLDGTYYVGEDDKPATPQGKTWADDDGDRVYELKTVSTPSTGGSYTPSIQKPTIEADEGIDWTLNTLGTKVTITVKDGYELADVTLNGVGVGKVTELKNLKTGDKVYISAVKVTDENEALIEKVKDTELVARSQMSSAKGKRAVKVRWYAKDGSSIDWLEGFEVFRSSKRYEGYTQKAFFETERKAYWNTLIKSGNKYYYKVRGYVTIDGVKYYTDWSLKAWRTVK